MAVDTVDPVDQAVDMAVAAVGMTEAEAEAEVTVARVRVQADTPEAPEELMEDPMVGRVNRPVPTVVGQLNPEAMA